MAFLRLCLFVSILKNIDLPPTGALDDAGICAIIRVMMVREEQCRQWSAMR